MKLTVEQWEKLSPEEQEERKDEMPEELENVTPPPGSEKGEKDKIQHLENEANKWKRLFEKKEKETEERLAEMEAKLKPPEPPKDQEEAFDREMERVFGKDEDEDEDKRKARKADRIKMLRATADYADRSARWYRDIDKQRNKKIKSYLRSLTSEEREEYGNDIEDRVEGLDLNVSLTKEVFEDALLIAKGRKADEREATARKEGKEGATTKHEILGEEAESGKTSYVTKKGIQVTPADIAWADRYDVDPEEAAEIRIKKEKKKAKR